MKPEEFATLVANASKTNINGPVIVNNQLVNNANTTLRHEDHIRYDKKIVELARERLNGIADLQRRGLTVNMGGLGTIISMYERVGDMTKATASIDGKTRGNGDRITFDEVGVPIPIIHKEWSLNFRHIEASKNGGATLPTTQMAVATRQVLNYQENMLFNGAPEIVVDGKTIYGYTTHPNRITGSVNVNWSTATGEEIVKDLQLMLQAAYDNNRFGPFVVYVGRNIYSNIQGDYSPNKGTDTIVDRMERFKDISEVKGADLLDPDAIVMVQMTEDVVDLAIGQGIRNIQWNVDPFETQYKIFSAMAPRIKADRNGSCGVIHFT